MSPFDSYLDPPEEPEPPMCEACDDGFGEYVDETEEGVLFRCDSCGHEWRVPAEPEPDMPDLDDYCADPPEMNPLCPHGKEWGECGACDHEGDIAYDAARERRLFR
jgi:hypothetical protein